MDAAYQRAIAGKRKASRDSAGQKGEKRRLIQLVISFCLFLIVFLGQKIFPDQILAWSEVLAEDTDFVTLFSNFRKENEDRAATLLNISNLTSGLLGGEKANVEETPQIQSAPEPADVTLLSETSRGGLQYIHENSFLKELRIKGPKMTPAMAEKSEPEVVTAVAQAYSPDGEELPEKVSFLFYELGLEKTAVPVFGPVTSEFGYRIGPISGKREFHLAMDIGAAKGTDILAFADGVVRYIGENDSFGLYMMIDHDNGVSTFYAHCSKLLARKGDVVTCGQVVAKVGSTGNSTGPHLHFTLSKDGIRLDPSYYVDPTENR